MHKKHTPKPSHIPNPAKKRPPHIKINIKKSIDNASRIAFTNPHQSPFVWKAARDMREKTTHTPPQCTSSMHPTHLRTHTPTPRYPPPPSGCAGADQVPLGAGAYSNAGSRTARSSPFSLFRGSVEVLSGFYFGFSKFCMCSIYFVIGFWW